MDKKLIKRLLDISYENQLHHLGSYFSCVETIDDIYSKMSTDDEAVLSPLQNIKIFKPETPDDINIKEFLYNESPSYLNLKR